MVFHSNYLLPLHAAATKHSWISTLEALRRRILGENQIINLVHHGIGAFPSLNNKVVQTAAFVIGQTAPTFLPTFVDIREAGVSEKEAAARAMEKTHCQLHQISS